MKTLEHIVRFLVPEEIVANTDSQLRDAGKDGVECFVLWSGTRRDRDFIVRASHVPRQTAYRLSSGLRVRVDADELHRLNVWLYQHEQELAVQVHTHPTEAYHSSTDDTYPMVTVLGGLSIVVPSFASEGLRGAGVAYYRLDNSGWSEIPEAESRELVFFGMDSNGSGGLL